LFGSLSIDSLHFLRNFSSRDSSILSVNEIMGKSSFFIIFIQLFFFALAIAALKSKFNVSLNFSKLVFPFLISLTNLLSGKPFSSASSPFKPKCQLNSLNSTTFAKFFNLSHSTPRLT